MPHQNFFDFRFHAGDSRTPPAGPQQSEGRLQFLQLRPDGLCARTHRQFPYFHHQRRPPSLPARTRDTAKTKCATSATTSPLTWTTRPSSVVARRSCCHAIAESQAKQWTQSFTTTAPGSTCLPVSGEKFEPAATGYIRENEGRYDRRTHEKRERLPRARRLGLFQGQLVSQLRIALPRERTGAQDRFRFRRRCRRKRRPRAILRSGKAHKADDGDTAWDSPWGRSADPAGTSGECSAMSKALLGEHHRPSHTGRRGPALPSPRKQRGSPKANAATAQSFPAIGTTANTCSWTARRWSKSLGITSTRWMISLRKAFRRYGTAALMPSLRRTRTRASSSTSCSILCTQQKAPSRRCCAFSKHYRLNLATFLLQNRMVASMQSSPHSTMI